MDNFNPTITHPWFSLDLQVRALRRCWARDVRTTVCRLPTGTIGEELADLEPVGKRLFPLTDL